MRLIEITPPEQPASEVPDATPVVAPKQRRKNTGLMIMLGIFTLLVLAFLWRTVFFYVAIVRGDVEAPTSFAQSLTIDSSLGATALAEDVDADAIATLDDPRIGGDPNKALLTIVEFADFGCPFSREASYIVRAIADHTDYVSYIYRDFPIVELHENAGWAAEAGECAQDQGRFFDYHDKMYQNQFDLTPQKLKQYARELGLDGKTFDQCLDSRQHKNEVEEDRYAGIEAGVRGTPTFFFNGKRIEGSIPREVFTTLLERYKELGEVQASTP